MKEIEDKINEIYTYLNDISHRVVRLEEGMEWVKRTLKWGFTIIGFLLGVVIGLL